MRRIPADNLSYPVSIAFGPAIAGSGFYLNTGTNVFLVTAKHVVFQPDGRTFRGPEADVTSYASDPQDRTPAAFRLNLATIAEDGGVRSHAIQDVVVVKVGVVEGQAKDMRSTPVRGVTVRSYPASGYVTAAIGTIKRFADVFVSNEIIVFGYPSSIGLQNTPQIDKSRPLLRKGIVAGMNEALKTIVLDCPVYPGNSGGPVLELAQTGVGTTQLRIIGVVIQFIPIVQNVIGASGTPQGAMLGNSGYAVAAAMDSVLELIVP